MAASRQKQPYEIVAGFGPHVAVTKTLRSPLSDVAGRPAEDPTMLVRPIGKNHLLPWNKGLVGQKKPLQPKNVWSIRAVWRS